MRVGEDTVFIYGDHAHCVRGITREIARDTELPTFVEGVILPFDGLITIGTILSQSTSIVPLDEGWLHRVEVMVELRGVVSLAEALLPLRKTLGKRDPTFYIGGLLRRVEGGDLSFRDVEVAGLRDGTYAHADHVGQRRARSCRTHGLYPAGDPAASLDLNALERWMRGHETYHALVTHLDGRVPEGADERDWAVSYVDGIVGATRAIYGAKDATGLMMAEDLELSEASAATSPPSSPPS